MRVSRMTKDGIHYTYPAFTFQFQCANTEDECRQRFTLNEGHFPVLICLNCAAILEIEAKIGLNQDWVDDRSDSKMNDHVFLFRVSTTTLPAEIADIIKDAIKCYGEGLYYPCVATCRRALEGIVVIKQARGRTLQAKIDDLANRKLLSQWAIRGDLVVRSLGNIACHFNELTENTIYKGDARICLALIYEIAKEILLDAQPINEESFHNMYGFTVVDPNLEAPDAEALFHHRIRTAYPELCAWRRRPTQ